MANCKVAALPDSQPLTSERPFRQLHFQTDAELLHLDHIAGLGAVGHDEGRVPLLLDDRPQDALLGVGRHDDVTAVRFLPDGLHQALAEDEEINEAVIVYLNRLSDLLFVLARQANQGAEGDVLWSPGAAPGP